MIRRASHLDAVPCSELLYLSSPALYTYFFASGKEKAVEVLKVLFEKPANPFSGEFFWVYEDGGNVLGAIVLFSGRVKEELERNLGQYGREIYRILGLSSGIKLLRRQGLRRIFPVIESDEYYIQALAVFPKFRGMGIGSYMLRKAFDVSRENGVPGVSLLVEKGNDRVVELYLRHGFTVSESMHFPEKYRRYNLKGLYKMVAPV